MSEQEQEQEQIQDQAQGQAQAQGQDQNQAQAQTQGQTQDPAQAPDFLANDQLNQSEQAHEVPESAPNIQAAAPPVAAHQLGMGHVNLADELGIADIYDPMFGKDGKVFCTAGRDAPIAEFTDEVLILHPPQMPLDESNSGEDFSLQVDARGILLDAFGAPKKIPAATFKSCPIYYSGEQKEGTMKHYALALAPDGGLHALFREHGQRLTTQDIYELRNKSTEGDLSEFKDIRCDL